MAAGDLTLTEHGTYAISSATLKTVVDSINIGAGEISGSTLYLIPTGGGQQISVIMVKRTTT